MVTSAWKISQRWITSIEKDFKIKDLGNSLPSAHVFENFRKKCIKIYELDPAKFLSPTELAWKAALKMTGVKLELLTDIDILLIVENGIKEE